MTPSRRGLAVLLGTAMLWAAVPGSPTSVPLGILTLAERAHLNDAEAFPGLSVFEGERLSTEAGGQLGLRAGRSTIALGAKTEAQLVGITAGVHVDLDAGGASFTAAENERVEVHAEGALIQPESSQATNGGVVILSAKVLQISARKSGLNFTYQDEFRNLPEGETYRIYLDAPGDPQVAAGAGATSHSSVTGRKVAYFIVGAGASGGASWLIYDAEKKRKHQESPARP